MPIDALSCLLNPTPFMSGPTGLTVNRSMLQVVLWYTQSSFNSKVVSEKILRFIDASVILKAVLSLVRFCVKKHRD